ncbi:hypothetical protein [Streptomyces sp. NBC_00470]|uniref:hypothetical protein n=1 Tax=Streptomyces sp. NBC_00470 TaxID=2975753 RepID=UPI002F91388E
MYDHYRADHLPLVGQDVLTLPTLQLQKIALTRIAQLTAGEIRGRPLEALAGWPDLSDCRKLYFDEQENDVGRSLNKTAPRWRIVYRLLDPVDPLGADRRMRLQVVAVGPRFQARVYDTAGTRLQRPEVARTPRTQEAPAPRRPLRQRPTHTSDPHQHTVPSQAQAQAQQHASGHRPSL